MRLLPNEPFAKLAYAWLLYLASPLAFAFAFASTPSDSTVAVGTVVAIAVFLPLYFRGYWLRGLPALAIVASIAAIGAALVPFNPGGAVFFVYAGAFAYRVGRPAVAVSVLAAIIVVIVVEALAGSVALYVWIWSPLVTALIGGVIIYSNDMGGKLKRAQADAHHLAIVAERERIGRDLHDLLGHTLSVITLKAELASKVAPHDQVRALAEIRDVERISREALGEVRRAVQDVRGTTVEEELLRARTALESAGAAFECRAAPVALSPARERALALSIREAVTNVIRHAHATRCALSLEAQAGQVRVVIRDNGRGGTAAEGSGLTGIRTRLAEFGGRLDRDGLQGTELVMTMPIAPGTEPAGSVAP